MVEVESRSRELALPDAHLDVALAGNGSPVSNFDVFKVAHASGQVATHSGRARQRKATSGHGQIATDTAAHLGIAGEEGRATLHFSLQGHVTGANQDAVTDMSAAIHAQRLHPAIDAVA